ncbi:MAG: LLM class F420-dependent oxidoreductase [Acidimicrobiales bacterium]
MSEPTGLDALGVTFASFSALGPDKALAAARLAEELGYRSFWTAEASGTEAFSVLAAAGQAAPSLDLGTGIVPIQIRSPLLTAMAAATLQALHPERDILLGIGISSPVITERWHGVPYGGEKPLARMREYVTLLRELLSGEAVSFAGDHYQVSGARLAVRLGERRPKIVLAALNPGMLRLAGELADGAVLNYIPASHVAWSVEHVRAGEAAAGRPQGACRIHAYVHAGVCEREPALEPARRDLFSYAVVDGYARNFARAGYGDEIAAIRAAHAAKDRKGAVAAVSDRMVDDIDPVGDAALVRRVVESYAAAGVESPVLMPLPWGPDRMGVVEATMRAAAGAA